MHIKEKFKIISFYEFINLNKLDQLKLEILSFLKQKSFKGTILLANEGVNGMLSCKKSDYKTSYKSSVAKKSEVNKFLNFIIKGLDKKGFLQPNHKRASMIRNINNIFHRTNLSEQEIRILLGIFSTLNEFNKKT